MPVPVGVARYALLTWVRDRYASLVDLETGEVLWFNPLGRGTGDRRDAKSARESKDALLGGSPPP